MVVSQMKTGSSFRSLAVRFDYGVGAFEPWISDPVDGIKYGFNYCGI